jgi:hypothetical protein
LLEALPRLARDCRRRSDRAGLVGARVANPSYSAGLEFELTGVAQSVELA